MSTCNKMCYGSAKEARKDIRRIFAAASRNIANRKFKAYVCPKCDNWHLTTMSKQKHKRVQANLVEVYRRLDIVKKLNEDRTVMNLLRLQENWMTLDKEKMRVACQIRNDVKYVFIEE